MCALIEDNLNSLEITPEDYQLVPAEASDYLRRHVKKTELPFDTVFFDPPYATDYEVLLKFIGDHTSQILAVPAIVIVEHHKKKLLAGQIQTLTRYRELKQGDSVLSFYRIASEIRLLRADDHLSSGGTDLGASVQSLTQDARTRN